MTRALSTIKTDLAFSATLTETVEGVTAGSQVPYSGSPVDHKPVWGNGTTSGCADRVWVEKGIAITGGGSVTIDLFDFVGRDLGKGDGRDAQGLTMALAEIAYISVRVMTGSGKLRVGGEGSAAAWNSGFGGSDSAVSPDLGLNGRWELVAWNDGDLAVADVSNHLLKLAAITADITVDLVILGRSA